MNPYEDEAALRAKAAAFDWIVANTRWSVDARRWVINGVYSALGNDIIDAMHLDNIINIDTKIRLKTK